MDRLAEYKNEFRDRKGIQFNNAGIAVASNRAAMAAAAQITEFNTYSTLHDSIIIPRLQETRSNLAKLLDAQAENVAFFPNCASALSQFAFGQNFTLADTVVTIDQEYASNFYPWAVACERSGAKLVVIPSTPNKQVDLEKLLAAIVPGVKCVGVSWVQFQSGSVLDLERVGAKCREAGARFIVDGIQGIGQLPISFSKLKIDALVGASHKWLCGLNGQAFAAIAPNFLKALEPRAVGSGTFNRFVPVPVSEATMEASAKKLEPGGISFVLICALNEAVRLTLETGVETIAAEISRLSRMFREGLRALESRGVKMVTPFEQAGGITSFTFPPQAQADFLAKCQSEEMAIVNRGDFLRASIHAYNTDAEVETVLKFMEYSLGGHA